MRNRDDENGNHVGIITAVQVRPLPVHCLSSVNTLHYASRNTMRLATLCVSQHYASF